MTVRSAISRFRRYTGRNVVLVFRASPCEGWRMDKNNRWQTYRAAFFRARKTGADPYGSSCPFTLLIRAGAL